MQQESGHARYYSLLAFTTFILFAMVTSANLLLLFFCWQSLSWLLSLLSTNNEHVPTLRAHSGPSSCSVRAMSPFSPARSRLCFYGTLDLQQFLPCAEAHSIFEIWPGGIAITPTPPSVADLHRRHEQVSAVSISHLAARLSLCADAGSSATSCRDHQCRRLSLGPAGAALRLSPTTLHWIFAVGMLTALLGSSMMLVQNDIKKTLGYSTIGQMGFMIMECGLGAYGLAIFHLIAHGFLRARSFFNAATDSCGASGAETTGIKTCRQQRRVLDSDLADRFSTTSSCL